MTIVKSKGFDLAKNNLTNKADVGYKFEVIFPETLEKTGIFITVRGDYSPTVKDHSIKVYNQINQDEKNAKKRGREVDRSIDELENMSVDSTAVRVITWEGVVENDKPTEFSEANLKRILKDHSWIREQINEHSQNLANFI
jgi:hypothetical protein